MLSDTDESFTASPVKVTPKPTKNGKVAIEKIYQKKSQLEHILLRPDTYIGSVENETKVCIFVDHNVVIEDYLQFLPLFSSLFIVNVGLGC